jgi:hypothetical protein
LVALHVPGRGLHLDLIFLWELLDGHFQGQLRVLGKIIQPRKGAFLVRGQRAVPVGLKKFVFLLVKLFKVCHDMHPDESQNMIA